MNAYYMTGTLDRKALRTAAVYRIMRRHGKGKMWGIGKLVEVGIDRRLATAQVEGWLSTHWFKEQRKKRRDLFDFCLNRA